MSLADSIKIVDRIYLVNIRYDLLHFNTDSRFEYMSPLDGAAQRQDRLILEEGFNPSDIGFVFDFCQDLQRRLQGTDRMLAFFLPPEEVFFTNTLFLIGAYIILKLERDLESTVLSLEPTWSHHNAYKENSDIERKARARLKDYLGALYRAKQIGWVKFGIEPNRFDIDEYRHLDNPLNADLHEIIPGKLIMMRGPRDLPGGVLWQDVATEDGRFVRREFSPAHYADILEQLDVQAVMRCSVPAYNREEFEAAGIAVVDLCCEDGAPPPIEVVSKFLAVVERLPGAVAVHCGSGPGPSGTLVGLYLMKHLGFTAREAMGWLRIVRPGCELI